MINLGIIMGDDLITLASRLERRLLKAKATVSAAESCTGGLLTSTLTDISGSSACFNQSWVTYSNESKVIELDVNPNTLAEHGAVSAEVALQMALGARKKSNSEIAISITGIAGPKSDDTRKKVGEVYIGISSTMYEGASSKIFSGDRKQNKLNFVTLALRKAIEIWDTYHAIKNEEEEIFEEVVEEHVEELIDENISEKEDLISDSEENWKDDINENWGELQDSEIPEIYEGNELEQNAGIEDVNWSEQE
ncbi:MAG: hypothetical protein CL983_07340 [Euryarchaeota archaeon]|nr:hypothetical protein [Euryarchaeota archaeon]